MQFLPAQIVTNGDMSQSFNSIGININQLDLPSIQAVWTGSPVGTLKIQISNDRVPYSQSGDPAANVINWTDYTGSTTNVSSAGDFGWNIFCGYQWARLVYTRTSGTGTLNSNVSAKG